MVSGVGNSSLELLATINTTLLKKTMDTNEALMGKMLEEMSSLNQAVSQPTSSNVLDIYA